MLNFVTIDFETATSQRASPCEIGLTFVENGRIKETKSWLIKPIDNKFDRFNISIHGITPKEVEDTPEFDQLWGEIAPLIKGKLLIAHNLEFDLNVLIKTIELYNLPYPNADFACSLEFSRNIWRGLPSYKLYSLCERYNITFSHHRAGEDSRATAELMLKGFKDARITSRAKLYDCSFMGIRRVTEEDGPLAVKPAASNAKILSKSDITLVPKEGDSAQVEKLESVIFNCPRCDKASLQRTDESKYCPKCGMKLFDDDMIPPLNAKGTVTCLLWVVLFLIISISIIFIFIQGCSDTN